jgi:curli biogenesis system outer membrane secretion channel CsgG
MNRTAESSRQEELQKMITRSMLLIIVALILMLCSSCTTSKTSRDTAAQAPQLEKKEPVLPGGLRKRIAVVDFVDKTDYGKGRLGIAASDILEGELKRTGNFTLVSHSGLDEVLNLQALGQSGAINPDTVVEAGKVVGANAIVNGSISEFGIKRSGFTVPGVVGQKKLLARAVVDINLIDGVTGVVLLSETAEGTAETAAAKILNIGGEGTYDETLAGKALRSAVAELVEKISAKMSETPWQGYILNVENEDAWITGGRDMGIQQGMNFTVTSKPKSVTAPNGQTYTLPGQPKGKIEVTHVQDDISQAKILEGEVAQNDIVATADNTK